MPGVSGTRFEIDLPGTDVWCIGCAGCGGAGVL
jgi:hypothetical protein